MNGPGASKPSFFTLISDGDVAVATYHRTALSDEDNIEQMGQELFSLVEQQQFRRVILNVSMVQYMTSAAIGKWITLHRKLARNNGALVLCEIQPSIREILETSRLLSYFNTADSVEAARQQLPNGEGE
jgi:anti-sigma B factor antagonist